MKCWCGRELDEYPFGTLLCPKCEMVSLDCRCEKKKEKCRSDLDDDMGADDRF